MKKDNRLLNAPDLVSRSIYEKVDGRKHLVAIERSSASLGLSERVEIKALASPSKPSEEAMPETSSAPDFRGEKRQKRNETRKDGQEDVNG